MKGRPDSRRREGCEAEDRDWTLCGRKHRREVLAVVCSACDGICIFFVGSGLRPLRRSRFSMIYGEQAMAKKKRKKQRSRGTRNALPAPAELARRGEKALAEGRYRVARDCYKTLFKTDPDRYRGPLVEAYRGMVRVMSAKGMAREAEEVVARIQEIGGEEVQVDPLLLVRSYLEKGDYHGVRRWCLAWLAEHEAASADEARPFVDALICSMEPGDPAGDAPTTSSIRDAAAIRQAITALGQGRFDEVLGRIRAIGASSPCNSWKLVLKALCAYYRRDESRARALLRAVPADSSLHNIAAVWDVLAGNEDVLETRFRDSAFPGQVCTAAGIRELRDVAVRCEYLWRVNRRRDALKTVCRRCPGFPSDSGDFLHCLTIFFFNAATHMEEDQAFDYLDSISDRIAPKGRNLPALALEASRASCLLAERFDDSEDDAVETWQAYIFYAKEYDMLTVTEEALVHERIADMCMEAPAADDFLPGLFGALRPKPVFPKKAEEHYRRCTELLPGYKEAYRKLLSLYRKWQRKRETNRLLDEIIKRFPDDAESLTWAGLRAVERKAFKKGMGYLERGLSVNPLDPATRERFVVGSIKCGLALARNGEGDRCRALMDRALEAGTDSDHDLTLGRPFIRARWAGFALLAGRGEDAGRILESVAPALPDPLYGEYFCYLTWSVYGVGGGELNALRRRVRKALSGRLAPEKAARLTDTWQYVRAIEAPESTHFLESERSRLASHAVRTVRQSDDVAALRRILSFASRPPPAQALARACIKELLRRDPEDPAARLRDLLSKSPAPELLHDPSRILNILEPIYDRARREGLDDIVAEIQPMLEGVRFAARLTASFPDPGEFDDPEDPFDVMELFDEDEEEDDDEREEEFDDTGRERGAARTPAASPRGRGPGRESDPDQLDLFDFNEGQW